MKAWAEDYARLLNYGVAKQWTHRGASTAAPTSIRQSTQQMKCSKASGPSSTMGLLPDT